MKFELTDSYSSYSFFGECLDENPKRQKQTSLSKLAQKEE